MREHGLLAKVFAAVLAGHLAVLPAVSIILPERMSRTVLRPVVLEEPSAGPPPLTPVRREPSPHLPKVKLVSRVRAPAERIYVSEEREVLREATRDRLASDVFRFPAAMPEDLAIAVRRVSGDTAGVRMPETLAPPQTLGTVAEGSRGFTFEITGLGGDRTVVFREPLVYPVWAQEKGMEGNVRIAFSVSPSGAIVSTELLVSCGYPELDLWVTDQFKRWRFNAAPGTAVADGEIVFRLRIR